MYEGFLMTKNTIILGMGQTGYSVARHLSKKGEAFSVADSRQAPPLMEKFRANFSDIKIRLGNFSAQELIGADRLIVSPGLNLKQEAIAAACAAGVEITGDIDIFSKDADAPIVAVTGSNGKSTVVSMLAKILQADNKEFGLGGNLDGEQCRPALDLLGDESVEFYILELSSFQLETTQSLNAYIAMILNLADDHMDRYRDLDSYRSAKRKIFNGCLNVVVDRNDNESRYAENLGVPVFYFDSMKYCKSDVGLCRDENDHWIKLGDKNVIRVKDLQINGKHNLNNALAAATLGVALGCKSSSIANGLREFEGLDHRCQFIRCVRGVDFYNDSKSTNVGSLLAGLRGFVQRKKKLILIAGGDGKRADFRQLTSSVSETCDEVILIGSAAEEISFCLDEKTKRTRAGDLEEAVLLASKAAEPSGVVLFSPGCASFDMFSDFRHRGETYKKYVDQL